MFWRHRKVLRDRAAGMVFDWRRGHGSAHRFLLGGVVSASFWGMLLAYVQIREPDPVVVEDEQIDLTILDLDVEQNRWLADLIDRETLFHRRWELEESRVAGDEIERLMAETSPRIYEPTLQEIRLPEPEPELLDLPGRQPDQLPLPEAMEVVEFARPPMNWWVEVEPVDGGAGAEGFAFRWEGGQKQRMSEGELWTVTVGVDWHGKVMTATAWQEGNDERTKEILDRFRALEFPALESEGVLRWWRFEARVVNRPLPE